jgi:CRISPR-associated protein Csb1
MNKLTIETLESAVKGSAAAFRCRRIMQPAGGAGDKVFPPTFAGAVYALEKRRVPGRAEPVMCVVLDTVQSQANRMEQALQDALDDGSINIPVLKVDFSKWSPTGDVEADKANGRLIDAVGTLTSLQVPHRLADAILRDSEIEEGEKDNDGKKPRVAFRKSSKGRALNTVSQQNATALYQLCPTALIFGMWDSTGPKGGLGAKFERAVVSEVVGIGAEVGDLLRGVRRDPLESRAAVKVLKPADKNWSIASDKAANAVSPSEVNHSSVPFPKQRDQKTDKNLYSGTTIEHAEQLTTLSLIALRKLRFPIPEHIEKETKSNDAKTDEARKITESKRAKLQAAANIAGQTVLAALGLCAATLAFENGMGLRSRCLLWPEKTMKWDLLGKPGEEKPTEFEINRDEAIALLKGAVEAAKHAGLDWEDIIELVPQQKLVDLVRLSQLEATKEEGDAK